MTPHPASPSLRLAAAGMLYLALHLLAVALPGVPIWGVDVARYVPGAGLLVGVGLVLLPLPFLGRRWSGPVAALGHAVAATPARRAMGVAGLAALAGGLFMAFPSAIHLLGDGALYLRDLAGLAWEQTPRVDRAPLTFWVLRGVHALGGGWDPVVSYRVLSGVSGVLFVLAAVAVSARLGRSGAERVLLGVGLLTVGCVQVFFGYVENYALPFAAQGVFLWTACSAAQGRVGGWAPVVAFAFAAALHVSMASMGPALVVLPFLATSRGFGRSRGRAVLIAAGYALAGLTLALVLMMAAGFRPGEAMTATRASQFLPAWGALGSFQAYRLFSPLHAFDALNALLLAAPASLVALAGWSRRRGPGRPETTVVGAAALGTLLFTLVINPEIGAFRDWDILSASALPLTLFVVLRLGEGIEGRLPLLRAAWVVLLVSVIHTGLWVSVNANAEAAEARFRRLMQTAVLSEHGEAYGWESLGTLERESGRLDAAAASMARAVQAFPGNPRLRIAAAEIAFEQGRIEDALAELHQALEVDRRYAPAHYNLGVVFRATGRPAEAVAACRLAVELEPDYAAAYNVLGACLVELKQFEEAIEALRTSVAQQPDFADAHYNLGVALIQAGRPGEARAPFTRYLALRPDGPGAQRVRAFLDSASP